ncbi:hypothetical protein FT663_00890 [Candidozyma haemuli var. vulneris]|uniref:DUF2423 domain-containing protein n=1 Tax=Candidozyma haemuli TaxID=45357 RepID=A0A2V1AV46_9ASCO|nr:hypothetical protein CXQ85_004655 [[Candida] haemuloni]KAF3990954.1 hypothetical protein FT662_02011 [[Candida] haemuloni var. vulneris]KAF3995054.1 hypothetical protein FT663_00890 [[Candida] haemuloni var. vulneris]PVH21990.1 hypothetical protein CXQ85_004655 [[Candida] haemuloni]
MAKSLRSKSKLRAKSIKRKGEFANYANERTARLAAKAKAFEEKQKNQKDEDAMEEEQEEKPEGEAEGESKPETESLKNVKTSGLKNTSRIRKRGLKKRGHTKF